MVFLANQLYQITCDVVWQSSQGQAADFVGTEINCAGVS
jgi:hypothetical protein